MGFLDKVLGGGIGEQIAEIVNKRVPDRDLGQKLEHDLTVLVVQKISEAVVAATEIIKAEAQSGHWLAANWRPLTALIFVGLIVARWFGYTAPNMTQEEYLSVYDLVKIMIGGYVVSRGIEKVAPSIVGALRGKGE